MEHTPTAERVTDLQGPVAPARRTSRSSRRLGGDQTNDYCVSLVSKVELVKRGRRFERITCLRR